MWKYRIYHGDGTIDCEGNLSPSLREAIIKLHGMAERGENSWEYEMYKPGETGVVSFRRTSLGVKFEKVGFLRLPPLPPSIMGGE